MKRIILLSDGTGNSSAKLFKTNVWRLYQALDLSGSDPENLQVACYNDGVGTSSFKPLAIAGGVFGWGLKRNVLHLYEFLCRVWEPGDQIYAFGFSRGAFTVRVLAGLIASQGIVRAESETQLALAARDAYRANRRRFNPTGGLVNRLRNLRDQAIRLKRRIARQKPSHQGERALEPRDARIAFLGVWDTVAAYGGPIAELTRGIDKWVWPLSMPDYRLSPKVEKARQALALNDERDTFHPLIWDELAEAETGQDPARLQQLWFAGMHADVGGGYPDDALSYEPLAWMIGEAQEAGLVFRPQALELLGLAASESAPMHDSRRGLGGYYRYQPRKIAALIDPPDPNSRAMRDPDSKARALLTRVQVHESVFERIRNGPEGYAPIVLPRNYEIVGRNGAVLPPVETAQEAEARFQGQEAIWNDVWRRRVNYFLSVGASLLIALLPFMRFRYLARACEGPQCLLSPLLRGLGDVLPAVAQPWIEGFARSPFTFAVLVGLLAWLLARSAGLQQRIHDRMWALWQPLHRRPVAPVRPWKDHWVEALRTHPLYQRGLQLLKWELAPNLFGPVALVLLVLLVLLPLGIGVQRVRLAAAERSGAICDLGGTSAALFSTAALCWESQVRVTRGGQYEVRIAVVEPWQDSSIATDPLGFASSRLGFWARLGLPLRRALDGNWFQPFVTVAPERGARRTVALEPHFTGTEYIATFRAPASGRVHLWVNDAVITWNGLTDRFYRNNRGTARVEINPIAAPQVAGQ
ncbi:MAG TPA: DUF2235 domain-containing protein [Acetobacteraceae bacterium]